jgi:hypothetical protein
LKKHQKQILVFAVTLVFTATVMLLTGLSEAGKREKPDPVMDMLDEIYDIVLDTNLKVEGVLIQKTGQTTILASGDDGDLQKGEEWPSPRFTDNGNGTVTDNLTHLIWTQDVNIYGATNWNDALTSCNSCIVGGYTDWYLPNVRELNSLIDYGGAQYQKLPAGHPFTGTMGPSWYYWTSTNHSNSPYTISFENGFMWGAGVNSLYKVWCVRSNN